MKRQEEKRQEEKERCPYLATDIIINYRREEPGEGGIILIERKNPPLGLALPGGFAIVGISLEENAQKEAREETGLEVVIQNPEHPLCVHSAPERDPRAHVVSVTYLGIGSGILKAGDDAQAARVYSIDDLRQLFDKKKFAFADHERALIEYVQSLGVWGLR